MIMYRIKRNEKIACILLSGVFALGVYVSFFVLKSILLLPFFLVASFSAPLAILLILLGISKYSVIFIVLSMSSFGLLIVGPLLSVCALILVILSLRRKDGK